MSIINEVESQFKRKKVCSFRPGDTVKVYFKVVEGGNERIQVFQGVVIRHRGTGLGESFTVRKISFGIGVERIFPLSSPFIDKIEINKSGHVRRARIFYLRGRTGKKARIQEKRLTSGTGKGAMNNLPADNGENDKTPAEGTE